MSEGLFSAYADVLAFCQTKKEDLAALLDPETGFAPQLAHICKDQLSQLEDSGLDSGTREELDALRLEEHTWGLLQALMPARKTDHPQKSTAREMLAENPYTPTATLAHAIMDASPLLTELVVVREWLHETAPNPHQPDATTGYWKFTKHNVMQAARTGAALRDGLVREMDPDVVNRDVDESNCRGLSADDTSYEKALAQALYGFMRAGRLEEAAELCRKAHQPWRAASIRGSLLFEWRAISGEEREEDAMDDDEQDNWHGNRRRKLWKATTTRAALNTTISDDERILFAALAPSPQTVAILESACRTWEDYVWAHVSIMCEEKQTEEMNRIGGGFWDGGVSAVERSEEPSMDDAASEEEKWEKEVIDKLESLKNINVEDGPAADHAFHFSQLHIILDRTSSLLEAFAEGLRDGSYPQTTPEYSTMCRFFAHLCLYLQMIDIDVPPLATQFILEAYLQVLEAAGQRDLIAMYAGALGDNAVERYAMFLTSLELSANVEERRMALTRAREHGLDMDRVAIATAERTMEKAFELLPPLKGPLPSLLSLQPPLAPEEELLLRSIEWTTFLATTHSTALEQANVIARYFMGSGRLQAAHRLLEMLPSELASLPAPESRSTEYLHYRQFFNIWQALDRVVDCQALEMPNMNKDTRVAWLRDYKGLVEQAREQIIKLLTSEWLVGDNEDGKRRRKDLIRIRQMYIPELIIRLHSILVSSRGSIPGNLKSSFHLTNIVADSRYKLYEDFVDQDGRRLGDYLGAVRQAILAGLEGGGSDPFRVVSARQ